MLTHCVISDPHVAPGQNLQRFNWLAKFLNTYRPQYLICLGDFTSLDSMSSHEAPGTLKQKKQPSLEQDVAATTQAHRRLFRNLKYKPTCILLKGNHEQRFDRFIDKNPALEGKSFDKQFDLDKYWDGVYEYREYFDVDGIRYTHVPIAGSGRPVSGVGKTRRVSLECTKPCIFGHGHDLSVTTHGEITGGPANRAAISAPAFMADGNIERYARGSHTGWSYGFLMVRPQGSNRIPSFDYVSMKDLKELVK